jgi:mannose-1-phosphate guanylyltransferase
MKRIKGLILCGGTGTRLRPITYYFQKTMIPIGLKQKPLLEYVVRLLCSYGISDLSFLVNYKSQQIVNYFDDGSRFGVKISYVHDTPKLRGTAGSVLNAYRQGEATTDDTLLVYYGDIITTIDLKKMLKYHSDNHAYATVALASGFSVRVGLADLDSKGKVRGFVEKPKLEKPVSIGIIVIDGEALRDIEQLHKKKRQVDLMKDLIPYLIENDKPVYGYLSKAFWYDIGSTEAYEKLDHEFVDKSFSQLFK